jgi:hypothetical protein
MLLRISALALALSTPATAQLWSDDFNRPDSTVMGSDWRELAGDLAITNGEGHGNLSSGWSKMHHNSAGGDWRTAYAEATYLPPSGSSGPHVALILGAGGAKNLYTKIQDNDSNGTYDRIFFYNGDNTGYWGSSSFVTLANPFTTARVVMYVGADMDSVVVEIDTNFDGVPDESHTNVGIAPFAAQLGNEYGIGTWAMGRFDDWQVGDATFSGTPDSVSVSAGGSVALSVTLGSSEAFKSYQVLGSVSGDVPGFPYSGVVVPLNPDAYMIFTLLNPNTPLLAGSAGILNSAGAATSVFTLPPGSDPSLVGLTVHHAAVVLELVGGTVGVSTATNSFPFALVP